MLKNLPPVFSLALLLMAIWFHFHSSQPQVSDSPELPETTFSTQRAFDHVEAIAQQPHYLGSPQHNKTRNHIIDELQQMGLEVQTHEGYTLTKGGILARPQNILSRIKGTQHQGDALILMTHYDSHPHSSPGASDAASGVATILEGVRAFLARNGSGGNDIILLFTDGEEIGLHGAQLFVKDHPWVKQARVALNFESRGSGGNSFMFLETNGGNAELIKSFKEAQPEYPVTNSLVYSIYKMLPNDTDLTILREQAGIPGYNFAFIDDHFDYHTATDTPENLDLESLAHQGSYLMPLLEYFKDADLSALESTEELIFFSIPGGELISYPFSWILPMLLIAILLFLGSIGYGIYIGSLSLGPILQGFGAFLISLVLSGLLTFLLWKFLLYSYPEFSEMAQGFTYNGYFYIAAAIFLSLSIGLFTYHRFHQPEHTRSLFVAPLFFWLLLCSLLALYLKGAAYFIIPVYFGLLQFLVLLRQKKPILLLMAFLCFPALFILLPFITSFPVALGLDILYASAMLSILLLTLLLPVVGFLKKKKSMALLSFLIFNVLLFIAHFQSDFSAEHPKPNSLVYLYDADKRTAYWHSYDRLPDEWTAEYFGKDPQVGPSEEKNFSSKYGSRFTWKTRAPKLDLMAPGISLEKIDSSEVSNRYSLKIINHRRVNRMELFADRKMDFKAFRVNGLEAGDSFLGENRFHIHTRRWHDRLLTYHVSGRDTLTLEFVLDKDQEPEFLLYESSYDLLQNPDLKVPPRPETMVPRPFVLNDAVIFKKTISLD